MNVDTVNLKNIEIFEFCKLNVLEDKREFFDSYNNLLPMKGFYYKCNDLFFALIGTKEGPCIYYSRNLYPINKELTIDIQEEGDSYLFTIAEYEISIDYLESKYVDFDSWSQREDVDLFYQIYKNYKNDSFYEKFTR